MPQTTTSTDSESPEEKAQRIYNQIKRTDYSRAPVTLWIVYKGRNADIDENFGVRFSVRRLVSDDDLDKKLSDTVLKRIQEAKRLERYDYERSEEQGSALIEDVTETSFSGIVSAITSANEENVVSDAEDLHRAFGYLIHLQPAKGPSLMAFRRVQASWKAKKIHGLINAFFKDRVMITAEEDEFFRFDKKIDFFATDGTLFILDKFGFESALNFRTGMEKKRDKLIRSLENTNLYTNLSLIRDLSGTHVRWLKKLAGAHKHGKCTESGWVDKLLECCKAKNIPVAKLNGKVVITPENCEVVVLLMNYDLLESPIDHVMFKIDGAKERY